MYINFFNRVLILVSRYCKLDFRQHFLSSQLVVGKAIGQLAWQLYLMVNGDPTSLSSYHNPLLNIYKTMPIFDISSWTSMKIVAHVVFNTKESQVEVVVHLMLSDTTAHVRCSASRSFALLSHDALHCAIIMRLVSFFSAITLTYSVLQTYTQCITASQRLWKNHTTSRLFLETLLFYQTTDCIL